MRWFRRAFGGDARASGSVDASMRKALLAVLDHDWEVAEEELKRAARLDSQGVVVYLALARLYRGRGEIGRAIRIHQNLLLRRNLDGETRVDALAGLAEDFRQGGFLQRAVASYEEVLAHRPQDRGALAALVRLLADSRDFARAVTMNRRLARLEKRTDQEQEAGLLVEMADAAHAEGRSEDARRILKRALRKDSRNVSGWVRLGALEAERDKARKALAAWRKVPGIDRRFGAQVYPRLEATWAALGKVEDYGTWLRGLLEERPDDPGARLALARHLAARGELEDALLEARRVLDAHPDDLPARGAVGEILLGNQRDTEAVKEYAELLAVLGRLGFFRVRESTE